MPYSCRRNRLRGSVCSVPGFTVIELLVSLVILGVLAMFISTAVLRAVNVSRSVQCVSQLSSIYKGFALYIQDNQGSFPPAAPPPPVEATWNVKWTGLWLSPKTYPEAGMPQYFVGGARELQKLAVCPTNKKASAASGNPAVIYHYLCNYEVMTQSGFTRAPARLGGFVASKAILLIDASVGSDWGFGLPANNVGLAAWKRVENRHDGRLNILWADGHITSNTKENLTAKDFELVPQ